MREIKPIEDAIDAQRRWCGGMADPIRDLYARGTYVTEPVAGSQLKDFGYICGLDKLRDT